MGFVAPSDDLNPSVQRRLFFIVMAGIALVLDALMGIRWFSIGFDCNSMKKIETMANFCAGRGFFSRGLRSFVSNRVQRGFTLIELMFVIALMGVLLGLVGPSFASIIQKNRIATRINALSGDFKYARAQAITNGTPVTVCPSSDGATCLGTTTWGTGWIVFSDANGNGTVNTGEAVLKRQVSWPGTDVFTASSNDAVIYNREGTITGLGATVMWTLKATPANTKTTKCVTVSIVGKVQTMSSGTGACT